MRGFWLLALLLGSLLLAAQGQTGIDPWRIQRGGQLYDHYQGQRRANPGG